MQASDHYVRVTNDHHDKDEAPRSIHDVLAEQYKL